MDVIFGCAVASDFCARSLCTAFPCRICVCRIQEHNEPCSELIVLCTNSSYSLSLGSISGLFWVYCRTLGKNAVSCDPLAYCCLPGCLIEMYSLSYYFQTDVEFILPYCVAGKEGGGRAVNRICKGIAIVWSSASVEPFSFAVAKPCKTPLGGKRHLLIWC